MKNIIKKILKEDIQGQNFVENFNKEVERFKKMKDMIINEIKNEYPNLVDYEINEQKVLLGSLVIDGKRPTFNRIQLTLKFKDIVSNSQPRQQIISDIANILSYFGFDIYSYGSPLQIIFKEQAWVNFG